MEKNIKFQIELGVEDLNPEFINYLQNIVKDYGILNFLEMTKVLFTPGSINIKVESDIMNEYVDIILKAGGIEDFIKFVVSFKYPYEVCISSNKSLIVQQEKSINNPEFFTPTLPDIFNNGNEEDIIEENAKKIDEIYKQKKAEGKHVMRNQILQYVTSVEVVGRFCEMNHIVIYSGLKDIFRCLHTLVGEFNWKKDLKKYLNGLEKFGTDSSWEYKFKFDAEEKIPQIAFVINKLKCPITKSTYDIFFPEIGVIIEIIGSMHFFKLTENDNGKFENKLRADKIKHDYAIEQGYTIFYLTRDKNRLKKYGYPYPVYTDEDELFNKLIEIYNEKINK